jgi:hypothetical protein
MSNILLHVKLEGAGGGGGGALLSTLTSDNLSTSDLSSVIPT